MKDLKAIAEIIRLHGEVLGMAHDGLSGWVELNKQGGRRAAIIVSNGGGWDHVSVHILAQEVEGGEWLARVPTWAEMDRVKRMCFEHDEVAMQLHVADEDRVNIHPQTLHLWKRQGVIMSLPPRFMV